MHIIHSDFKNGEAKIKINNQDDLWHLSQILHKGDAVKGKSYRKIKLGASLVQLITGLIYQGPTLVAEINNELPKLLKKDGFENISEAIGTDNNL